jgi:DNA-binding FrmR family transcriptional regulator
MQEPQKSKSIIALKKASSHIQKIITMIEEDAHCNKIMQQLLAVQGYLKSAQNLSLKSHLHTCGAKNLNSTDAAQKEKFIDEIIKVCGMAKK